MVSTCVSDSVQASAARSRALKRSLTRQPATESAGLGLQALSDWRATPSEAGGLLMGFANFATAAEAETAVRRFKAVMV
ncbi:hypothetical protein CLM71_20010 [Serratia sp. MYb239]|uniref:hypothetical protein n=1 Tax=Serratia sp. MYb239 TaxID=2033438 RepID=UPI000CF5F154|nr:hypothetical protein [Serratia sp. MYb239]AVJ19255.1 hypothetical protein CLM71_20010 [Serratia sp. MYb239]